MEEDVMVDPSSYQAATEATGGKGARGPAHWRHVEPLGLE
jgi:hypothetical protein